jgi:hypothetical protein
MEAAAKIFFSSPRFAVVGASQDTSKFGYKSESLSSASTISGRSFDRIYLEDLPPVL